MYNKEWQTNADKSLTLLHVCCLYPIGVLFNNCYLPFFAFPFVHPIMCNIANTILLSFCRYMYDQKDIYSKHVSFTFVSEVVFLLLLKKLLSSTFQNYRLNIYYLQDNNLRKFCLYLGKKSMKNFEY